MEDELNYSLYNYINDNGVLKIDSKDENLHKQFQCKEEDIIIYQYLVAIDRVDLKAINELYNKKENDFIYNIYKRKLLKQDRINKIINIFLKENVHFKVTSDLLIALIKNKDIEYLKQFLKIIYDNSFIIEILSVYKNKVTLSKEKWKEFLSSEIDRKTGINQLNSDGDTPLTFACKKKLYDIVKILIENGADVNKENRYGDTPLIIACKNFN